MYPTTPRGDTDFQKWEEEEEKKYQLILRQISSSENDTEIEESAKEIIANVKINAIYLVIVNSHMQT